MDKAKVRGQAIHIPLSKKQYAMAGIYGLLALAVLLPLLRPGYILTLDMVFTPHIRMPSGISSSYLFYIVLHILNLLVSSQIIEKGMLLAILLLSGVGMHQLVQSLQCHDTKDDQRTYGRWGAYFAGTLYMINPFVYSRFMAGQYLILLGYSLLPFFVRRLLIFLEKPTIRNVLVLSAWAIAASIVSIHSIGMMLVFVIIAGVLTIWRYRRHTDHLRRVLKYGLLGLAVFLAASSYWLVPLALGHGSTATAISQFSATDQQAFATTGQGSVNKLTNVLGLDGFWAEGRDLYLMPQDVTPAWGVLLILLWIIIITGLVAVWRAKEHLLAAVFGLSTAAAAILAAGIGTGWLAKHLPFFAGYREPQKFVAIVALGYAFFGAQGIGAILRSLQRRLPKATLAHLAAIGAMLIPIAFTFVMFRGFDGQLQPSQYPADWYTANQRLHSDPRQFQTLFLPWHLYMKFDFSGRIIASPAPAFFDKPMVVNDNPEFRGVAPDKPDPEKQVLSSRILPDAKNRHDLGAQLAPLGIAYVLLAHDDDYRAYDYLNAQTDLQVVSRSTTLTLYRNLAYRRGN